MTVNEFITEQATNRARAAKVLADELEINGVVLKAGCRNGEIEVGGDINYLAAILGCDVAAHDQESTTNGKYFIREESFTFDGVKFCTSEYIRKTDEAAE